VLHELSLAAFDDTVPAQRILPLTKLGDWVTPEKQQQDAD
jgi:hypothetical protein